MVSLLLNHGEDKDNRSWKKAYAWIKDAIDDGRLEIGASLPENGLAKEIGISRTPIREALRRLEEDNYVRITPLKGAVVADISVNDVREIYEIRKLLEPFAGLSTAHLMPDAEIDKLEQKWQYLEKKVRSGRVPDLSEISGLDLETHLTMLAYSNNKHLTAIISSFHSQIQRLQMLSAQYLANVDETIREHLELMECLRERNPRKFRLMLYDHIVSSEANIMRDCFLK